MHVFSQSVLNFSYNSTFLDDLIAFIHILHYYTRYNKFTLLYEVQRCYIFVYLAHQTPFQHAIESNYKPIIDSSYNDICAKE